MLIGPGSWFPDYYSPRFMGVVSFLFAFFVELPKIITKIPESRGLQISLAVGLILSGLGSLGLWGLHQKGIPYDKFVHFVMPALLTYSGIRLLSIWKKISIKKSTFIISIIIGICGVAWEYVEFYFRHYFQIGFFGQLFDQDSLKDIIINFAGILAGIIFIIAKKKRLQS